MSIDANRCPTLESLKNTLSENVTGGAEPASAEDQDRFADAPISRLVGFQVEPPCERDVAGNRVPLGHAVVSLECSRHHHNPMGRVHGGLIAALADAAMGIAFGRTLMPGEDFSTIDMQI